MTGNAPRLASSFTLKISLVRSEGSGSTGCDLRVTSCQNIMYWEYLPSGFMITGEPGETFVQPIPCGCAGRLYIPGGNSLVLDVRNIFRACLWPVLQ